MQRVSLIGLCVTALVVFEAVVMPRSVASAQGLQTGTVTGVVESSDGVALPGVQVTANSTTSQTYTKAEIDALPIARGPADLAAFAPGVSTPPTSAAGQIIMGGAFGFDNVFMVNGVDVNDNILGTANDLFIEDAIQEASVLTHGISAEYGRFSGGVVNIVTKSGGNTFSGSFRQNLTNPAWIAETPRQIENGLENPGLVSHTYEATLGGPIIVDRLWFFGAGRYEDSDSQHTFSQSGGAFKLH